MGSSSSEVLRFDRFTLDMTRGSLRDGDREIDLARKPFEVLSYLASNAGRLVSKTELFEVVWPKVAVSDDSLVQCIRELRRKLGDDEHRLIKTISRRGYRFDAAVTPQFLGLGERQPQGSGEIATDGVLHRMAVVQQPCNLPETTAVADAPPLVPNRRARAHERATAVGRLLAPYGRRLALPIALVAAAIAIAALWGSTRPQVQVETQVAPPDRQFSLVVLPFQNLGGDPEQEYFADGVTVDLMDGLSRLGGTVIARGTAFSYKGRLIDVREIGRDLGVRYILDGTVRRSGDEVRVAARLADSTTASTVWTETFDIDRRNLARLRDDVAARLAQFFKLGIIHAESARSLRERPRDAEAWDFLMRAWSLYYRTPRGDVEEPRRLFREALRRDESLRDAWIGLSHTYLRNVRFSPTREGDLLEADAAAERAMTLDPHSSFSHIVMGWVRYEQKRMNQALVAFDHANKLNPNEPIAHASIGAANIMLGLPENALEPLRRAMQLSPRDPSLPIWQLFMGVANLHLRRDVEADWLRKSVTLNPTDPFSRLFLASALALSGREAEAKVEMAELRRLNPQFTLSRFKAREPSKEPSFLAQRERIYEGLLLAGAPE